MDFVEICNDCARRAIIEAAKRIINSDKVCHSYSDLNFGVTFFGTQCIYSSIKSPSVYQCLAPLPMKLAAHSLLSDFTTVNKVVSLLFRSSFDFFCCDAKETGDNNNNKIYNAHIVNH